MHLGEKLQKHSLSYKTHLEQLEDFFFLLFSNRHTAFSSILADELLILLLKSTLFGKMSVPPDIEISWHSVPGGFPLRITQQKRWMFN